LKSRLDEIRVGVVYISHSNQDHAAAEGILKLLGDLKISTVFFYAPHHGADFAFHVGTIVGKENFGEAKWAFNWPHLKQLLKSRNVLAHEQGKAKGAASFDLTETRTRLGLSQEELARALNVTSRTIQNWEAQKSTSQMMKKTRDLRELLTLMDDYVAAPKERSWLSSPLEAFRGRSPIELISAGRIRDLVIEFERLREGQPV
jgi:transcriptional regulator with XRE-family HTH domain